MPLIVLFIIVCIVVFVMSHKIRALVFHGRVLHFFVIAGCVTVLFLLSGVGYAAWKYWWPLYMKIPVVEWTDITLEHEDNPDTPGAGGPKKPTVIQVR